MVDKGNGPPAVFYFTFYTRPEDGTASRSLKGKSDKVR